VERYYTDFLILVFLTITTGPHTMSDIDLESQVARAGPHAGAFFPLVIVTAKVVTARKDVEGAEMHEMYTISSHTSSVASSVWSVSTGQDIDAAELQGEGVTSILPCCLILRRLFYSITVPGRSDAPDMNFDQSSSRDDVSSTTNDRPIQSDAQTCACFLTILEMSMT
jgi:hypothetical protein